MLNVEFEMINGNDEYKVEIINSLGQTLQTTNLQKLKTAINIKELPTGVYVLNLRSTNSQTVSKRFVVAR